MVTSVQLGNFFTANGRSVLGSAGGSGIDTKAIIDGLVQAKSVPQQKLKDTVTLNGKKSDALSELQTLMSKLKDSANFLRNPPGVGNASDNVFKYTSATVTASTGVAGDTYMGVSSAAGASLQSYTINEITSVAQAKKQGTGNFVVADTNTSVVSATPGAGQFGAGTITIRGQNITLTAGDSLNTVVNKFNQVSADTKISAGIVQVGTGQYRMVFSATSSGLNTNFNLGDAGDLTPNSVTDPSSVLSHITFDTTQVAANAVFKLDGATITRQTNTITDVVDGVTFNVKQLTPGGTTLTASINPDQQIAKNGIINFVNAYNDLRIFAAKQMKTNDDGSAADDAILIGDTVLRSTLNSVGSELSRIVNGLSGNPNRLSDLGMSFADLPESKDNPFVRNIINLDEGKLDSALSSDFSSLRKVFEFTFTADNANLGVYSRTNALSISSMTLNLTFAKATTQDSSAFSIADANQPVVAAVATPGMFTAGSVTIKGATLTLSDGDTLSQVIDKFNAIKTQTGIQASLKTITPGVSYGITFTATATGTANAFDLSDPGTVTDPSSVFANVTFATTQAAANSSYTASYANPNGSPASTDVDVTAITGGGYTIKGRSGTVLDGLVMIYSASSDASIAVSMTQGIGDRIYNIAEGVANVRTGTLKLEKDALQDSTDKLNEQITKYDNDLTTYRNQLLDKFAAMEKAISQVNSLLQSLDAQDKARNASSG